jgi:3-mercaptopyruvate sulfurtransferase SseA
VALRLKRRGILRVRPLAGGYDAWVANGYPLQTWAPPESIPATPLPAAG